MVQVDVNFRVFEIYKFDDALKLFEFNLGCIERSWRDW